MHVYKRVCHSLISTIELVCCFQPHFARNLRQAFSGAIPGLIVVAAHVLLTDSVVDGSQHPRISYFLDPSGTQKVVRNPFRVVERKDETRAAGVRCSTLTGVSAPRGGEGEINNEAGGKT